MSEEKKKMGRPPLKAGKKKGHIVSVYLKEREEQRLTLECARTGESRSEYIEKVLIRSFFQKFPKDK